MQQGQQRDQGATNAQLMACKCPGTCMCAKEKMKVMAGGAGATHDPSCKCGASCTCAAPCQCGSAKSTSKTMGSSGATAKQ
ncbi:hypothetical protein GQ42DRAFT_163619 [Ramicandelaber brevisporus]|nr:hypothetical protein GQ42DRAFT_163619 [Ramicandelaber brevisporus]